jgi:hypothetical protein
MKVNGEDYHKLYLEADLLKDDMVIDYVMGPEPNKTWFTEAPPSLTKGDETPKTLKDLTYEGIPLRNTPIPDDMNNAAVSVSNVALTGNNSAIYLFDDMSDNTGNNSSQSQNKTTYDVNFTARTTSITYFDPQAPQIKIYTLTSSNTANRDPSAWTLSASNDGTNWVELDKRSGEVFKWRRYTRPFAISEAAQGRYRYYKLDITDASGTGNLILAQVEFLADHPDWKVSPAISKSGNSVTVNASVINNKFTAGSGRVCAALYTAAGRLVDFNFVNTNNIAALSSANINAIALDSSNAGENCFVKVFLWDQGSFVPLANEVLLK